jgi:hypothetical protein
MLRKRASRMSDRGTLAQDHARYRALTKDVVEALLRNGFTAENEERVRLYQSEEAFGKAYPDQPERTRMLDRLEMHMKGLQAGLKRLRRTSPDIFSLG